MEHLFLMAAVMRNLSSGIAFGVPMDCLTMHASHSDSSGPIIYNPHHLSLHHLQISFTNYIRLVPPRSTFLAPDNETRPDHYHPNTL